MQRYYRLMQAMDSRFCWKNPDWWRDDDLAKVIVARTGDQVRGFMIVGYGCHVDPDVESEICEVYSEGGLACLRALYHGARLHLTPPWGFQVMKSNMRARAVFEWLMRREGLRWSRCDAQEHGIDVIKYRVKHGDNDSTGRKWI
jgi:hypothetical protein